VRRKWGGRRRRERERERERDDEGATDHRGYECHSEGAESERLLGELRREKI
jgi:hypothetical protein